MNEWIRLRIISGTAEEEPLVLAPDDDEDQGPSDAVMDPPAGPSGEPEPLEPSPGPSTQPQTQAQTGFAGLRKGFLLKKVICQK